VPAQDVETNGNDAPGVRVLGVAGWDPLVCVMVNGHGEYVDMLQLNNFKMRNEHEGKMQDREELREFIIKVRWRSRPLRPVTHVHSIAPT